LQIVWYRKASSTNTLVWVLTKSWAILEAFVLIFGCILSHVSCQNKLSLCSISSWVSIWIDVNLEPIVWNVGINTRSCHVVLRWPSQTNPLSWLIASHWRSSIVVIAQRRRDRLFAYICSISRNIIVSVIQSKNSLSTTRLITSRKSLRIVDRCTGISLTRDAIVCACQPRVSKDSKYLDK